MLPDIRKIASEVLVSLCDSECSSSSTITTENDRAIADLLVCLFPPKDSSGNTLASECAFLMSILSFIVDQCQPWQPGSVNAVFKLQQANIILRALYIALSESDILAYIVDFILLDSVPSWWDTEVIFPSSSENTKARNCKKEEVCSKSFDQLHSEVAISFSSLLLIAAWHSNRSLKNSETCQRLLNRLKGSSLKEASLVCSYNGHQIMGFEDIGARTEAQQECVELRERLDNETAQRISLEAQLAKTQKLLDEERDASSAVEQYCQDAERKAFDKSEALKSLKEDYRELLADADRKVKALEDHHRHHDLMLRAEYLGREAKLDAALEEAQDTIKQKEEELQRERDEKEKLSAETERVMAQLREEVGRGSGSQWILLICSTGRRVAPQSFPQNQGLGGSRCSTRKAAGASWTEPGLIKVVINFDFPASESLLANAFSTTCPL